MWWRVRRVLHPPGEPRSFPPRVEHTTGRTPPTGTFGLDRRAGRTPLGGAARGRTAFRVRWTTATAAAWAAGQPANAVTPAATISTTLTVSSPT